jgi:hypothetical protein
MTTLLEQPVAETEIQYTYESKIAYIEKLIEWKAACREGEPSAQAHLKFIIERSQLRKTPSDAKALLDELKRAFGPICNQVKLANGRLRYDTLMTLLFSYVVNQETHLVLAREALMDLRFER